MTSMTRQYSAAASQARNAVDKTADVWTEGARAVTGRLFGLPQVDLVPAVERYFDLVQWTVDINRRLAVRWAEAAATLSGAVREKAESAGDVVREKAEAAGDIAREQAENAERAARLLGARHAITGISLFRPDEQVLRIGHLPVRHPSYAAALTGTGA